MSLGISETSYPSQIPTPLQEPISKLVTQEEPMDSTDSDIPNLIDITKEVLFHDYLLLPCIWTHLDDAKLADTNSYCNVHII